jgi:asparagine synthase (glutamine-hydrolysing)
MCGIAGFIDRDKTRNDLERMVTCLSRRGPDDSGIYYEDGVALGHRRLAIIDLSPAGHQPMSFEHLVIIFNGEIYNYREVRDELKKRGYHFQTSSDTEVVIKAFHLWGPECVNRFIGMFAIAVYDQSEKSLCLVRDRAGVKPLYYYFKNGAIAFASELKSFRSYLKAEDKQIDKRALSEFLSLGYISSGLSILENVKKLPQGHYLRFSKGSIEIKQYWNVTFREDPSLQNRKEDDLLDELENLVVSAFKYRMVADVPVGVFLSAGVDSSLVTSVLTKHYDNKIRTFTIGFHEKDYDESADARKIADHLGTVHTEGTLEQAKALSILEHFYEIYDEPHGDNSCIPTAFVSELAKNNGVKVVLSADGGDELFGGYTRYLQYMARWSQISKMGTVARVSGRSVLKLAAMLNRDMYAERLERFSDILSKGDFIGFYQTIMRSSSVKSLTGVFPDYQESLTTSHDTHVLNQMCQWDFNRYMADDILVKVDRATMYHSIEGREPFLDHRLIEFAAALPVSVKVKNGETKYILKKLLGRYLPESLYRLPKRGFAAPLQTWIKDFYVDKFYEVLGDDQLALLDKKEVRKLLENYRQGRNINYSLLWFLFSFQLWYRNWTSGDNNN